MWRGLPAVLVASISVALYYNITFFGKALVALPSLPVASACLFYYISAFNTTTPTAQVALWMLSFAIAGVLCWGCLKLALTRWGTEEGAVERCVGRVQASLWVYALPLPWLLWVHAQSPQGPSWEALQGAILVRDHLHWTSEGSEWWLNGLFLTLALLETSLAVCSIHQACGRWKRTFLVISGTAGATLVALCAVVQALFWLRF